MVISTTDVDVHLLKAVRAALAYSLRFEGDH